MNFINLNTNLIFSFHPCDYTLFNYKLSHPTHANWVQIVLWKLLAADIERIEGIGAVGTVFEKVFF